MPLLDIQGLKTYIYTRRGVVRAVDGVSFSVEQGETFGLVGESGCGKTITSLSIMKLVPEPGGRIVEGAIYFDGEDLVQKSERAMRKLRGARMSMILQDSMTSLNPAYTIGDQVSEAFTTHSAIRGPELRGSIVAGLKMVKIPAAEARLRDYPHQMSGGMRQRVVGAIALASKPGLIIADEPTTSLDVTIQAQYLNLLKEVQQRYHVALLFVTHDFGVVARMCDRVAVMYAGRIVEKAATEELFDRPMHPYTDALMSCVPRLEAGWRRLESIAGQPPDLASLPEGCSFAPRCARARDICHKEYPDEMTVGPEHQVSCWSVENC